MSCMPSNPRPPCQTGLAAFAYAGQGGGPRRCPYFAPPRHSIVPHRAHDVTPLVFSPMAAHLISENFHLSMRNQCLPRLTSLCPRLTVCLLLEPWPLDPFDASFGPVMLEFRCLGLVQKGASTVRQLRTHGNGQREATSASRTGSYHPFEQTPTPGRRRWGKIPVHSSTSSKQPRRWAKCGIEGRIEQQSGNETVAVCCRRHTHSGQLRRRGER